MAKIIPYCYVELPLDLKANELPDLQNIIQGVVKKLKPLFDTAQIDTQVFHGHQQNGRNDRRPPRILYQVSSHGRRFPGKKAALLGLGEGAMALKLLFEHFPQAVLWNGESGRFMPTQSPTVTQEVFDTGEGLKEYALIEWLALSDQEREDGPGNYQRYLDAGTMAERLLLMEDHLKRHLQRVLRHFSIETERPLRLAITEITKVTHNEIVVYGHTWYSFNLTFATNLVLPNGIAVGNAISRGFGKIMPLPTSPKRAQRLERLNRAL
ncbi:MAG: CRISPR-associated endonuclease Cas6 [Chitinophagales bacterium]